MIIGYVYYNLGAKGVGTRNAPPPTQVIDYQRLTSILKKMKKSVDSDADWLYYYNS